MTEAALSGMSETAPSSGDARTAAADSGEYGGFWIRTLAYSADISILVFGLTLIGLPFTFLGGAGIAMYVLIGWLGPIAYFVWFTSSAQQATPGKQLCGLKVEQAGTGERISMLRALGRELGKYVSSAVLLIGFFMIGFTRRKQGLHDLLATTVVVREGPPRILLAVIVAFGGILIPVIVISLMFGAVFAAMMAMMMGGVAAGAQGGGEMKRMNPMVPRIEQPAQRPRPAFPSPQTSAPKSAFIATAAAASVPQFESRPAADAPIRPEAAKPSEAAIVTAVPVPVAALKPAADDAARPGMAVAAFKPRAPESVFIPPALPVPAIAPKFNDLMTAVLYSDADGVAELLELGKWPDKPDSRGLTPLMIATQRGDSQIADLLLKAGADPKQQHGLR